MKIYGKILKEDHEKVYFFGPKMTLERPGWTYFIGDSKTKDGKIFRSCVSGCSGKATQLLPGSDYTDYYEKVTDVMSWGYAGLGSDLMAVWLLARGTGAFHEFAGFRISPERLALIHRHYRAFSDEVIANLPDEWEMDIGWVKQWVEEREKKAEQPC